MRLAKKNPGLSWHFHDAGKHNRGCDMLANLCRSTSQIILPLGIFYPEIVIDIIDATLNPQPVVASFYPIVKASHLWLVDLITLYLVRAPLQVEWGETLEFNHELSLHWKITVSSWIERPRVFLLWCVCVHVSSSRNMFQALASTMSPVAAGGPT